MLWDPPLSTRTAIIGDYIDGLFFSLNLISSTYILNILSKKLLKIKFFIQYFAALTFCLYLFHMPLLRLFSGISPFNENPSSILNILFIFSAVSTVVIILGSMSEKSKKLYSVKITKLLTNFSRMERP